MAQTGLELEKILPFLLRFLVYTSVLTTPVNTTVRIGGVYISSNGKVLT